MRNSNERRSTFPGIDLGFNAHEVEPKAAPKTPAARAEAPSTGPQRPIRDLPDSDSKRARLLPSFVRVADELGAELAADETIRRAQVAVHLGMEAVAPVKLDPVKLRGNLGSAVNRGELDEASARKLWEEAFPGQDPGSVG